MSKVGKWFMGIGVFALPMLAAAENLEDTVGTVDSLLRSVIPIIMVLAILYFFWGLVKYIQAAGDAGKASEGKSIMIYGIIALFVMSAIWGLVGLLSETFVSDGGDAPDSADLLPT